MDSREAFEAMMRDKYPMTSLAPKSSDYAFEYLHVKTQRMFLGFQAALASQVQQTESRWISVNERLPEPWTDVLVHPRPTDYICEAQLVRAGAGYWFEYFEYERNNGIVKTECNVTYWMPLPPAPEGGKS